MEINGAYSGWRSDYIWIKKVKLSSQGDRKKKIDTSDEKGRQEAAIMINKLMKQGVAIFLERGKKAYRKSKWQDFKRS